MLGDRRRWPTLDRQIPQRGGRTARLTKGEVLAMRLAKRAGSMPPMPDWSRATARQLRLIPAL